MYYTCICVYFSHLLLQVTGNMTWKTPSKRSVEYVSKIGAILGPDRVYLDKKVTSVTRKAGADGTVSITVKDANGGVETADIVVFACHPDQALAILGSDADDVEKNNLAAFTYSTNDTYVHTDTALMPRTKEAWTCWNYIATKDAKGDSRPVFVTYWLNKLQNLKHPRDIFVSLNPSTPPAADKILSRIEYTHPQYTAESVQAQRRVAASQGHRNTYFCG